MDTANIYCLHRFDAGSLLSKKLSQRAISEAGYELLRTALKDDADLSFSKEDFRQSLSVGVHGKPYLAGHPEIEFNLSHSEDCIVLAIAPVPIGIDVQAIRDRRLLPLAKRIYNEAEYAAFLEAENQTEHFFRSWVEKESFVKWTGEGITRSLKGLPDHGWVRQIELLPGFACAICAERELALRIHPIQTLTT